MKSKETLYELDKYKKALKILKKHLNLKLVYDDEYCDPTWFLNSNCGREIEQEEAKVLEEVLNNVDNNNV